MNYVENNGKLYPPKDVVSLAIGVPKNDFFGGRQGATKYLSDLGFATGMVEGMEGTEEQKVVDAIETTFTLERDLQSALRSNIEQLEMGLKITDGGSEKSVPSGRIDITAEDKTGSTVIIELKAGQADRDAIGQILAYMGDVRSQAKGIRGILVAGDFTPRLVAAASMVSNIQLRKYSFKFSFEIVGQARSSS